MLVRPVHGLHFGATIGLILACIYSAPNTPSPSAAASNPLYTLTPRYPATAFRCATLPGTRHDDAMTRRRRFWVIIAVIGITAVLTAVVTVRATLDTAVSMWGVVSALVAFGTTVTGMRLLKLDGSRVVEAEIEAALVADVRRQLDEEERLQRLNDPWPIPLQLTPADPAITDHWRVIRRGDCDTPLPLTGSLPQIGTIFAAIPSGRMVIIGPAGSGKTVAARRLAMLRADDWQAGMPVPVLLSLAAWNLNRQSLRQWLIQQIAIDHPAVPRAGDLARTLLEGNRLLVILDGFDEIAPGARQQALTEINRNMRAAQMLVVTSRADEYKTDVTATDVLTGAAVLQLQPVPLATAFTFLQEASPPATAARWQHVQSRITDQDPLAVALRTPLFVTMARSLYDTAGADPGELLDQHRLPNRGAVERALLGQYLEQAVQRIATDGGADFSPRRVAAVRRHLRTLAAAVHAGQAGDVGWWRLPRIAPPAAVAGPITALITVAGAISCVVLLAAEWQYPDVALAGVLAGAVVAGPAWAAMMPPRSSMGARANVVPRWLRELPVPALFVLVAGCSILVATEGGLADVAGTRALLADVVGLAVVTVVTVWALSPSWGDVRFADWDRHRERWLTATVGLAAGSLVFLVGGIEAGLSTDRVRAFAALTTFTVAATTSGFTAARRPATPRPRPARTSMSRSRVVLSWLVALVLAAVTAGQGTAVWLNTGQLAVVAVMLAVAGRALAALGPGYREPRRVEPRLGDAAPVIVPQIGTGAVAGAAD